MMTRTARPHSDKDHQADWTLTRLWMHACIKGDEAEKDCLFYQQGRGMAGMYAYELFLARRTVEQERARGGGDAGHDAAVGGAAGGRPAGVGAGGGAGVRDDVAVAR